MYQLTCKVDVDMLNTVKSVLADVSSVSPSLEQSYVSLRYNGILVQEQSKALTKG